MTYNSQQPTANSQQPTANSQQPTANSQQPTANSQQLSCLAKYQAYAEGLKSLLKSLKSYKDAPLSFDELLKGKLNLELVSTLLNTHLLTSPRLQELLRLQKRVLKAYSLISDEQSKSVYIRHLAAHVLIDILGNDLTYKLLGFDNDVESICKTERYIARNDWEKPIMSETFYKDENVSENILMGRLRYEMYYIFGKQQYNYINEASGVEIKAGSDDIVFDVGSCFGETTYYFSKVCGAKQVHAFEPDRKACKQTVELVKLNKLENVQVHDIALADQDGEANFTEVGNGRSSIHTLEETKDVDKNVSIYPVKLQTLDSFVKETGIKPTFIKADIEGAEGQLLTGSFDYIRQYKPTFAISAYHGANDAFNLLLLLHKACPEYKFYFKKVDCHWETVLFATVK